MFQSAKQPKTCKEKLKNEDNKSTYVYIYDHLPSKFPQQQKNFSVLLQISQRKESKNSLESCLYVDNREIEIPQYFEIFILYNRNCCLDNSTSN